MVQKLINGYCRLLAVLMVVSLAAMVVMVFGNVVMRYVFNSGITLSEELSRWLFVWLIFMGATVAVHERAHMGTDMLVAKLPRPLQQASLLIGCVLMLFVTWLMLKGSWVQTQLNWDTEAPVSGLSQAWPYAAGVVFAVSTGIMLTLDLWAIVTGRLTHEQAHLPVGLEPAGAEPSVTRTENKPGQTS